METQLIRVTQEAYNNMKTIAEEEGRFMTRIVSDILVNYFHDEYLKPKKPTRKKQPEHPDVKLMKEAYLEYWKLKFGMPYSGWTATNDRSLNSIRLKIEKINESEISTVDFWKQLLTKLTEFWADKSLFSINKNFNKILIEAKQHADMYNWNDLDFNFV